MRKVGKLIESYDGSAGSEDRRSGDAPARATQHWTAPLPEWKAPLRYRLHDWLVLTALPWLKRRLGLIVCDACGDSCGRDWGRARELGWSSGT